MRARATTQGTILALCTATGAATGPGCDTQAIMATSPIWSPSHLSGVIYTAPGGGSAVCSIEP